MRPRLTRRRVAALVAGATLYLGGLGTGVLLERQEPDEARYQTRQFSFSYPAGWERIQGLELPFAEATGQQQIGEHTLGVGSEDWVTVYALPVAGDTKITLDNLHELLPAARDLLERVATASEGGRVLREPEPQEAAGLPGWRAVLAYRTPGGREVEFETTQLYRGITTYVIGCQWTTGGESEIVQGCERVLETFEPAP